MMSLVRRLLSFVRRVNRKRLFQRRVRKVQKADLTSRMRRLAPNQIQSVLLIDAQGGWGDSLYVMGLIRALAKAGKAVCIATLPNIKNRYQTEGVTAVFDLSESLSRDKCASTKYDIAVDTTYVSLLAWDLRYQLLQKLECYAVACGDVERHSNLYDEYLDLSRRPHQSERMALVCNRILMREGQLDAILPYFSLDEEKAPETLSFFQALPQGRKFVYINGLAREKDRCFSTEQMLAIRSEIEKRSDCVGIFLSAEPIEESSVFKALPHFSYQAFAQVLESCCCVVSVDTSAVHLASALGIPTLAFFCGNDRDHYPQYRMEDVWRPLAEGSEYFSDNDDPSATASLFYQPKLKDVSAIPVEIIRRRTADFLERRLTLNA